MYVCHLNCLYQAHAAEGVTAVALGSGFLISVSQINIEPSSHNEDIPYVSAGLVGQILSFLSLVSIIQSHQEVTIVTEDCISFVTCKANLLRTYPRKHCAPQHFKFYFYLPGQTLCNLQYHIDHLQVNACPLVT